MGKKEAYKEKNLQYLQVLSTRADICSLPCGIFYEVLQAGTGTASPTLRSIVTVHYKGSLINGKEFDNSYSLQFVPKHFACVMSSKDGN